MKAALLLISVCACAWAGSTTAVFNSTSPNAGPFPSNALTVSDNSQKTGIRVALPPSFEACNAAGAQSVCSNTAFLNQLDGFSVNPRIQACFSGPIDTTTLAAGVAIARVSGNGAPVTLNQIIYDPASNCAFAKPNQVLNQQTQYVLVITDAVHDTNGGRVTADPNYTSCLATSDVYCTPLAHAVRRVSGVQGNIVDASLFTTMSATAWLEQARRYVDSNDPSVMIPAGFPYTFDVSNMQSMTWVPSNGDGTATNQVITPAILSGVGSVAFGLYLSPNYLDPNAPVPGSITSNSTKSPSVTPVSAPGNILGWTPIAFHVFLPSTPKPRNGYPVAIYGHGLGDTAFGAPTYIASTLAQNGIATLAFEIPGHGYGAGGVVNVIDNQGKSYTVLAPGRGVQLSSGPIGSTDGCITGGAIAVRDCGRQTAVDLFALIDTIRATNGLGMGINPSQVYYVGQSFGGTYGTLFHATEPNEKAAVLNGDGGTSVDVARLALTGRPLGIAYLEGLGLLNLPGDFNDNYVFRDEPPVVNNVTGAMVIQAAFEAADWLGMLGDPLAYAPHLASNTLSGVPAKSTLFQFGIGDLEVPNPTESNVVRAANAQQSTWVLQYQEAVGIDFGLLGVTMPGLDGLPILPHRTLANPTIFGYPGETSLALAEQQQVAAFFASGGSSNPNPNPYLTGEFAGVPLFQIPQTLPTQLNYFELGP